MIGRTRIAAAILVLLQGGAACSGSGSEGRASGGGALHQGVVANIDGTAITLAEVEALAARGGLTPKSALERLEAEALLAREAERRGYASIHEVEEVGRQALVQALLAADVERERPTPSDLDQAYAQSGERFSTPERRSAMHVLAVLPKKPTPEVEAAARTFTVRVIAQLRAASDPNSVLLAVRQEQQPFAIKVEQLPPTPRKSQYVAEFSEALFSLEAPGIVPDPVRTQFGWHAIWLREILPAEHVPEAVARAQLSREIELNKRRARLEALVKEVQQRAGVAYAQTVRDALAVPEY